MALWGPFTQNGNTTAGWWVAGGNITNHEAFAVQLSATSPTNETGATFSNLVVYINPTKYTLDVTAVGPQAITYYINSDQV
jgi:hypothetical protein